MIKCCFREEHAIDWKSQTDTEVLTSSLHAALDWTLEIALEDSCLLTFC